MIEGQDLITQGSIGTVVITVIARILSIYQKKNTARDREWEKKMESKADSLDSWTKRLAKELDEERKDRTDLKLELKSNSMKMMEHNRALEKIIAAFKTHIDTNKEKTAQLETQILELTKDVRMVRLKKQGE